MYISFYYLDIIKVSNLSLITYRSGKYKKRLYTLLFHTSVNIVYSVIWFSLLLKNTKPGTGYWKDGTHKIFQIKDNSVSLLQRGMVSNKTGSPIHPQVGVILSIT